MLRRTFGVRYDLSRNKKPFAEQVIDNIVDLRRIATSSFGEPNIPTRRKTIERFGLSIRLCVVAV